MRLKNKVAIITGAASGIGRATALLFAREGAKVVIADINSAGGNSTVREIESLKGEGYFVLTDVAKSDDARELAASSIERFGRIDILANVAGIGSFLSLEQTTEDELDRVLNVNVKGVFFCSQSVVPHLRNSGGGSIINVASINGLCGAPGLAAYSASKGAIISLTRTLALELAEAKIRVNCLCPASVDTPILQSAFAATGDPERARLENIKRHPLGRLATPEDVALYALFLASDESSFVTGGIHVIDGGASVTRR